MFDIGWTEMMVVAVIAIIFVGPKELPGMLRTFGRSVKKIRMLAGDFQRQFNDAIDDAELGGVRDSINDVRNLDPTKAIKDKLNPLKNELDEVKETVEKSAEIDPTTLFDESKAPQPEEPVKVDVEAALKRQQEIDAAAAKQQKAAKPKPKASKPKAKTAAKKPAAAKTTAAKTKSAPKKKPATSKAKKKPVKKASA